MEFYQYKIISYEIIDLDSVRVILDFGFNASLNIILRLYGIDAPEKKNKEIHLKTKEWLQNRLDNGVKEGKTIWTISVEKGKFAGRYMGLLFVGNDNINNEILRLGYAKPYQGGSRAELWPDEDLKELRNILDV